MPEPWPLSLLDHSGLQRARRRSTRCERRSARRRSKLRLVFLCDKYWPSIGGIETLVRALAKQVSAEGHKVSVVTMSDRQPALTFASYSYAAPPPHSYEDGSISVRVVGASAVQRVATLPVALRYAPYLRAKAFGPLALATEPFFRAAHLRGLRRAVAGADVVHSFGAQYLGAAGGRAARRESIPFVITPFCHPGHWGDDPMNVRTYVAADMVFGLNEFDRQTYCRLGVPLVRTAIMPVPIGDVTPALPHTEALPYILYVGRVNQYKGVPALFEAWRRDGLHHRATLLVAGPSDGNVATPPGARYLGAVSEEEKRSLLAGARALVLPSKGEIMPTVILEAWAQGTPVIVSDIPALVSFVRDGKDGVVSPTDAALLSQALAKLIDDPALAAAMGAAGRERVLAEHTAARVAGGLLETYQALASRSTAAA